MRPFRFGLGRSVAADASEFAERARQAEDLGYSTILAADHLGAVSPEVILAVAATVTSGLRIGTFVANNDLRHPLVLAQLTATLDLMSDGRLELGIGAGWNRPEYDAAGLAFDRPSVRIDRLEETAIILRRLFGGEEVSFQGSHYTITEHRLTPLPPQGDSLPLLFGGNGDRMLRLAAEHGDIIGLVGATLGNGVDLSHFGAAGAAERITFVREAAGDRAERLELNVLVQHCQVTPDRRAAATAFADRLADRAGAPVAVDTLLDSPFALFGTVEQIAEQLRRYRAELGISYVTFAEGRGEGFDQVVETLAGS